LDEAVTRDGGGAAVLRAGWVAKGVLYAVVGVLAVQVAIAGGPDEQADQQGALRAVRDQPLGAVLLGVLAVGLAAYAVWRFVDAWTGDKWVERAGHVISGLVHLGLAVVAAKLVLDSGSGGGSRDQAPTATARALEAPGGRFLVGVVGVLVAGVGVKFVVDAVRRSFLDDLDLSRAGFERGWLEPLGVVGSAARGVVFVLIGWFIVRAALQYDPDEARGLDGALHALAGRPYGPLLLFVVALGLVAYGAFAALSARSRKLPT
jgi:hypothetical protein